MTLKVSKRSALLAGAAVVALGMGASTSGYAAEAKVVSSGNDKVSLKISGQFSRQITYIDDGESQRVRHMDSNLSSSRFLMDAAGKINADLAVGARAEIAFDDNRNALTNAAEFGPRTGNDLQTRKAEIHFTHKGLGKVWVGSGDLASNGIMNIETHGVYGALPTGVGLFANPQYRDSTGALSGDTMIFNADPDFNGRAPRIRYDTPVLMGFMASVSQSDNQSTDVALRYSATMLDTKISAGASYLMCDDTVGAGICSSLSGGGDVYGGGIAATHASGIGGNAHITVAEDDDRAGGGEPWLWNAQLHYGKKFSELGKTTIVGEYQYTSGGAGSAEAGDVGHYWSAIVEQEIDAAALEVFLRYTNAELSRDGTDFADDINIVGLGARLKF